MEMKRYALTKQLTLKEKKSSSFRVTGNLDTNKIQASVEAALKKEFMQKLGDVIKNKLQSPIEEEPKNTTTEFVHIAGKK